VKLLDDPSLRRKLEEAWALSQAPKVAALSRPWELSGRILLLILRLSFIWGACMVVSYPARNALCQPELLPGLLGFVCLLVCLCWPAIITLPRGQLSEEMLCQLQFTPVPSDEVIGYNRSQIWRGHWTHLLWILGVALLLCTEICGGIASMTTASAWFRATLGALLLLGTTSLPKLLMTMGWLPEPRKERQVVVTSLGWSFLGICILEHSQVNAPLKLLNQVGVIWEYQPLGPLMRWMLGGQASVWWMLVYGCMTVLSAVLILRLVQRHMTQALGLPSLLETEENFADAGIEEEEIPCELSAPLAENTALNVELRDQLASPLACYESDASSAASRLTQRTALLAIALGLGLAIFLGALPRFLDRPAETPDGIALTLRIAAFGLVLIAPLKFFTFGFEKLWSAASRLRYAFSTGSYWPWIPVDALELLPAFSSWRDKGRRLQFQIFGACYGAYCIAALGLLRLQELWAEPDSLFAGDRLPWAIGVPAWALISGLLASRAQDARCFWQNFVTKPRLGLDDVGRGKAVTITLCSYALILFSFSPLPWVIFCQDLPWQWMLLGVVPWVMVFFASSWLLGFAVKAFRHLRYNLADTPWAAHDAYD
jgi:hypothetical protein